MVVLAMTMAMLAVAEPATAPADKAAKDPNEIVCKREKVSGSNLKQRVCMPAREWEERRQQDKEMIDDAQRRQPMKG